MPALKLQKRGLPQVKSGEGWGVGMRLELWILKAGCLAGDSPLK